MGSEPLACPLCGTAMADATSQSSGRTCRSCGARLIGLAPFERLLQEGVGNGVWIACAETPRSGPACPFCQQGMHQPPPEAVMPKDLSVCRLCQQVLVPASATEWMTQFALSAPGAGPVAAPAPATPTDCSNCGAPYEPDENGCCRYCHAQIAAIPAPIVFDANPYGAPPVSTGRALEDLAGLFLRSNRF